MSDDGYKVLWKNSSKSNFLGGVKVYLSDPFDDIKELQAILIKIIEKEISRIKFQCSKNNEVKIKGFL